MASSLHIFSFCLFLMVPVVVESQNPASSNILSFSEHQERRESDRIETKKGNARSILKATERLKQAVNGVSVVEKDARSRLKRARKSRRRRAATWS